MATILAKLMVLIESTEVEKAIFRSKLCKISPLKNVAPSFFVDK
jgi:hypothetical protein